MMIEVDVNGAQQIKSKLDEAVSIFIMPPSYNELRNRLSNRGTETQQVIDERMHIALSEIARAKEYDYIIVNDRLDKAVDDLICAITNSRLLLNRQKHIIDEVLKNA